MYINGSEITKNRNVLLHDIFASSHKIPVVYRENAGIDLRELAPSLPGMYPSLPSFVEGSDN